MIFGRNSTTVTSAPSRDQTEPSSSPIAPPPTTTSFFGMEGNAIASSDETTDWPSNFMDGNSTGAEPVAMTMFAAVYSAAVSDFEGETRMVFGPVNSALPQSTV